MAALRIPDSQKRGLTKLLRLPDNSLEELISALERVRPKLFAEDLSMEIISEVRSIPADDMGEIIDTLLSLFFTGFHHETPPEELAEQVVGAMTESGMKPFQLSAEAQASFRQRLIRLFNIETLLIAAKALDVLLTNENTFCSARILTDIRPVFGSDVGVPPSAAVIVHMLDLSCHHEGELKHFYIAMDTVDIQRLREVLDRADLKAQSLKGVIERGGVTYLDPQGGDDT
jgi:hypothetical protein